MRFIKILMPAVVLLASCSSKSDSENTNTLDSVQVLNSKYAIAYQIDDKIVATNIDTTKQVSFGGASEAAISPDGNKLAYTVADSLGNHSIWYADMENKSQNEIKVNSQNYGNTVWDVNSHSLAFSVLNNKGIWKVGYSHLDNSGQIIFDESSSIAYFNPTWKNSQEIITHDLVKLYTFNLEGKLISTEKIADLLGSTYKIDKNTRFFYANEGKNLIFNAHQDQQNYVAYNLNVADKSIKQVSVAGVDVKFLFVTFNNELVYSGTEKNASNSKIYKSDLNGNTHKVLVDKGSNPSAN